MFISVTHTDSHMEAFAQACISDSCNKMASNNTLVFESTIGMQNGVNTDKGTLFVRECYAELCEEISGAHEPVIFVTGTPGTGKSMFRNYVAYRRLRTAVEGSTAVLIVFQAVGGVGGPFRTVHFDPSGFNSTKTKIVDCRSYNSQSTRQVAQYISDTKQKGVATVSLVDVSEGAYQNAIFDADRTYLFTSGNESVLKRKDRNKEGTNTDVIMPLWELAELQAAAAAIFTGREEWAHPREDIIDTDDPVTSARKRMAFTCDNPCTDELIEERVRFFGATARAAFDPSLISLADKLKEKLSNDQWTVGIIDMMAKDDTELATTASHSFIHLQTKKTAEGKWRFRDYELQWASAEIRALVAAEALRQNDTKVMAALANPFVGSAAKGDIVEELWLSRFLLAVRASDGDKAAAYALAHSIGCTRTDFTVDAVRAMITAARPLQETWCPFKSMSTVLENALTRAVGEGCGVLLRPFESTMPAIDAILVGKDSEGLFCLFLQVTIAREHRTRRDAAKFFNRLITVAQHHKARSAFIFVLPHYRFLDNDGKLSWRRQDVDGGGLVAGLVQQFALCPGLPHKVRFSLAERSCPRSTFLLYTDR